MNRKADRALATLRGTRSAEVSNELRDQRLLLEARALSDLGRHDLALEVIANLDGRETSASAFGHLVGGAALGEVGRADRTLLRRPLEGLAASE